MNRTYRTIQGDTWDMIAYKIYGNELYMNELLEANAKYQDVVIFPAGITLIIPEISRITEPKVLPPWKR